MPLPQGLREAGETMSWETFVSTFNPGSGPLRLGSWECDDDYRSSSRLGSQARTFRASLAIGDRIDAATARACGAVAALTAMLHERGIAVEMTRFHQLRSGNNTATFVCGQDGQRTEWAMGWSNDATQSALRALISCANRLLNAT